jgi:hypothetical protein
MDEWMRSNVWLNERQQARESQTTNGSNSSSCKIFFEQTSTNDSDNLPAFYLLCHGLVRDAVCLTCLICPTVCLGLGDMHGANKTLEQAQTWRKHVCHTWQTGLEVIVWLFRGSLEANCWVAVAQSLGS